MDASAGSSAARAAAPASGEAPPAGASPRHPDDRILLLAPSRNDARLAAEFLDRAGLRVDTCGSLPELAAELAVGCGALLLAEESLGRTDAGVLTSALDLQPAWSDLPITLITSGGEAGQERLRRLAGFRPGGNVTFLERPFRPDTLVSVVDAALRARRRQYQVRDLLEERTAREARLRRIFAHTTSGIVETDPEGRVTLANERFCQIVGRPVHELAQLRLNDLTDRRDRAPDRQRFNALVRDDAANYEIEKRYLRPDGSFIWVREHVSAIRGPDGRIQGTAVATTDIHESRRQAEELAALSRKIEAQSRLFDITLSSISDLAYIFDHDARFVYANQRCLELWQLPLEQVLGRSLGELGYPPALVRRLERQVAEVFATRQPVRDESPFTSPDGAKLYFEYILSPVLAKDGSVEVVAGFSRDTTDRVRAEAVQSERARLADLRSELAFTLAKDRPLREILQECAELFVRDGWVAFARVWVIHSSSQQLELHAHAGAAIGHDGRGEPFAFGEFKAVRIARSRTPLLTNAVADDPEVTDPDWARREQLVAFAGYPLVVEDRSVGVVALFARETLSDAILRELKPLADSVAQCVERKRAEEALAAHARRTGLLGEKASQLLISQTPETLLGEIFERAAAEVGADIFLNYFAHGDGHLHLAHSGGINAAQRRGLRLVKFGAAVCGVVAQQREPVVLNYLQHNLSENASALRELGVRAYASQPLQAGDRLLGTISFASTRRDRFYDEELNFMRAVGDLVAASVDRARLLDELSRARDAAELANRTKDDFLAALSHELRTPLNPVLLLATEAAQDPDLPAVVRGHFDTIAKNVTLEARLIDDLLDLTRIARGKLSLDLRPVELHGVLHDALATMESELEHKRLQLSLRLQAARHRVQGDAVRLQQVLWNVLKNAAKFTPEGGHIVVETEVREATDTLVVRVVDSGIGMLPDEIERIFDAFAQGDHARSAGPHRFGGLGLGLAISRMLVESHGGRISAASEGLHRGAVFTIELPLLPTARAPAAPAAPPTPEPAPVAPAAAVPERTILLVEDHEPTRTALTLLLNRRHHRVVTAGSLQEAREAAAREPALAFMISDIGLPDGDGYHLMAELHERHGLRGIALTGYGSEDDIERSQAAGFVVHLTKPVRVQSLETALARITAELASSRT